MTALEYMERQLQKHRKNRDREQSRGVPDEMLSNIEAKIGYYEAATEVLRMAEELKLYIKDFGDRKEYLYGPSWKGMELFIEGGYSTPEEAKRAWEEESKRGQR